MVEVLYTANGGKAINSQRTIVAHSPLTKNVDEEIAQLEAEAQADSDRIKFEGMTF
jgi:hypothetical protein